MMRSNEAMLETILADPGDDAPRLVYADWLEDEGENAYAEFIRLQCAMEWQRRDSRAWHASAVRAVELMGQLAAYFPYTSEAPELASTREELLDALRGMAPRRGFPSVLAVVPDLYRRYAPAVHLQFPFLHYLRFEGVSGLQEVWETETYENILGITIDAPPARRSYLPTKLVRCRSLHRLTELRMSGNRIGVTGLTALCEAKFLPLLKTLHLADCGLGQLSAPFTALPFQGQLRDLVLDENEIGDKDLIFLLTVRGLAGLLSLSLARNQLTSAGLEILVGLRLAPQLKSLNLAWNRVGNTGVQALTRHQQWRLEALNLTRCMIGDRALEHLVHSPIVERLEHLDLSYNHIQHAGVEHLCRPNRLPPGIHIRMHDTPLTDRLVDRLIERFGEENLEWSPAHNPRQILD
jgi:uncharacterized protein (TIGR02996 family)